MVKPTCSYSEARIILSPSIHYFTTVFLPYFHYFFFYTISRSFFFEVVAFKKEREIMREELEALEILKARYTELESDYNRLVKPARSKVGRYVVSIHYWKDESGFHYALRLPGADRHTELSRAQLHTQLKAVKNQYGIKLYTAVWFPDDTSLSHAEASSFTSRIHSLYDYYYSKN